MKVIVLSLLALLFSQPALAHGMSEADKARALEAGWGEYIQLGAGHMLTGYDHLLFLFGVIFFLTRFMDIVKFITAFTLGHSITLIFATFYEIKAEYHLVDAVIALTVVYKGFDNLDGFRRWLGVPSPNLLWMVFSFGLIHGFGLSTRLQMLPLADEGLLGRIIAFNVGVELGQILALSVMIFALSGWRRTASFVKFSKASNVLLMAAGLFLLLMQLHGYLHARHPDSFPLNKDDHAHTHADMIAPETSSALDGYPQRIVLPPDPPAGEHSHGDGPPHSH